MLLATVKYGKQFNRKVLAFTSCTSQRGVMFVKKVKDLNHSTP